VRRPDDDSLNEWLVSPWAAARSTPQPAKATITLIKALKFERGAEPYGRYDVGGLLQNAITGSRFGTRWRNVTPAMPDFGSLSDGQTGNRGLNPATTEVVTMDQENREHFETPKDMRSMAEAGFDQARKTFDNFLANAQQAATTFEGKGATVRADARDISARAVSYAEKNVQASLDYAQNLVHAKDLGDIMRLHSDYVQSQMRALAEQASEMGQRLSHAAMDAAKPKH
jgi:phasin